MLYHAVASLPGGGTKTIINKTEQQMLTEIVIPYVSNDVISAKWAGKIKTYQAYEIKIYKTDKPWDKRDGKTLDEFVGKGRNIYSKFERTAKRILGKTTHRVFIIMPIQGEKFGSQDEQRIYKEFDDRFEALRDVLNEFDCVAIRIDKEYPLEELVKRIKEEIRKAKFLIADLTDERPSCYFEAGFAEGLSDKRIIYIASKESVLVPKKKTDIHFDVHMNVNYFTNHDELKQKVRAVINKNLKNLLPSEEQNKSTDGFVAPLNRALVNV